MWVCVWLLFHWVEWLSLPGTLGKPVKERHIKFCCSFTRFWTAGERGKILHASLSLSCVGPSRSLCIILCLFSRCWQLSQYKTPTLHILQTLVYREEIERKLCRKCKRLSLSFHLILQKKKKSLMYYKKMAKSILLISIVKKYTIQKVYWKHYIF